MYGMMALRRTVARVSSRSTSSTTKHTHTTATTTTTATAAITGARVITSMDTTHGVATIVLSNPGKLNALTEDIGEEFAASVRRLNTDASLRAVILTGEGNAFSAGGDLKFLEDRTRTEPQTNSEQMKLFYARFLCIRTLPVPVIAAINGPAVGAGLCLAGACDMRLASESARLGWTFATLGIHPGMAATHFTAQLLGPQQAARLLYTGEVINAEEAAKIGLVLATVPDADLIPRATALAHRIARASPVAVRTLVRTMRAQQDKGLAEALQREADAQAICYAAPDLLEGLKAIRERRTPVFPLK